MKLLTPRKRNLREFIKEILTEDELSLDQIIYKARERSLGSNMTKKAFVNFVNRNCRDFVAVREITVPSPFGTRKLSMYSVKPRFR